MILLAGLAVGVLVGNVCLGAWLVFAAVRRLTRRSRPSYLLSISKNAGRYLLGIALRFVSAQCSLCRT